MPWNKQNRTQYLTRYARNFKLGTLDKLFTWNTAKFIEHKHKRRSLKNVTVNKFTSAIKKMQQHKAINSRQPKLVCCANLFAILILLIAPEVKGYAMFLSHEGKA